MELLDRLFIKRKRDVNTLKSRDFKRSTQITPEQVRLLLFKECDWRGRKLLFDSSTIDRKLTSKHDQLNFKQKEFPYVVEISEGFTYVYKGPAEDSSLLGEMIFGAVAMNYGGVSLKIHMMDEPRRLMCSKVFCVPSSRDMTRAKRKTNKENSNGDMQATTPLSVPTQPEQGMSLSFCLDRGDSGYYGEHSSYSSMGSTYDYFPILDSWDGNNNDNYSFNSPSGRKLSTSSNGSWQRRTYQNLATRFELGYQSSNMLHVPTVSSNMTSFDSQLYSTSNASGTRDSLTSTGSTCGQRRNKLGLALVITVDDTRNEDLVQRCVEHSPQLQALVCRLRLAAMAAGASAKSGASAGFVATLHRAARDAANWLSDLIYGPRVQPMWLTLASCKQTRAANKMAESMLSDLCAVLSIADTKDTNFFISTLLTYILTYHLAWVTTVSPYDIVDKNKLSATEDSKPPYNALWAQLEDLTGSIGFPPKAARTIIRGANNIKFLNRLLVVLTYFVRCGDVKRKNFFYEECVIEEKVINVDACNNKVQESVLNTHFNSSSTLVLSEVNLKRNPTLASFSEMLSNKDISLGGSSTSEKPIGLKRNPTNMIPLESCSGSSSELPVSELERDTEEKVVFVLGDNEKLVGLKNKSVDGKCVKKSTKVVNLENDDITKEKCDQKKDDKNNYGPNESPSKCCSTLQHSKPIKHSGLKFEFDKYPQIVTNYMKSKNLEILDRHYIGKPGNLKLDNFTFDPTVVPPIQEERYETCYKCQLLESMLQTPTNASELEYMNDIPRQSEPQYAKQTVAGSESLSQISPKTFIRRRKSNTLVVNIDTIEDENDIKLNPKNIHEQEKRVKYVDVKKPDLREWNKENEKLLNVKRIIEFPMSRVSTDTKTVDAKTGFDASLLGGVTDHYVPDLVLQGTTANPSVWEAQLRRDLDLTTYLNKSLEAPFQAVAIIGDTSTWEVSVVGGDCGAVGMSGLVAVMLDAVPAMWRANVPAHQCLRFLEEKLREFCVLSKTLADMLMSTDFCDIASLTKALNIDINDVPLLLAVATTHTPQVARRYGISNR